MRHVRYRATVVSTKKIRKVQDVKRRMLEMIKGSRKKEEAVDQRREEREIGRYLNCLGVSNKGKLSGVRHILLRNMFANMARMPRQAAIMQKSLDISLTRRVVSLDTVSRICVLLVVRERHHSRSRRYWKQWWTW